jgi:hypothetical protein
LGEWYVGVCVCERERERDISDVSCRSSSQQWYQRQEQETDDIMWLCFFLYSTTFAKIMGVKKAKKQKANSLTTNDVIIGSW